MTIKVITPELNKSLGVTPVSDTVVDILFKFSNYGDNIVTYINKYLVRTATLGGTFEATDIYSVIIDGIQYDYTVVGDEVDLDGVTTAFVAQLVLETNLANFSITSTGSVINIHTITGADYTLTGAVTDQGVIDTTVSIADVADADLNITISAKDETSYIESGVQQWFPKTSLNSSNQLIEDTVIVLAADKLARFGTTVFKNEDYIKLRITGDANAVLFINMSIDNFGTV